MGVSICSGRTVYRKVGMDHTCNRQNVCTHARTKHDHRSLPSLSSQTFLLLHLGWTSSTVSSLSRHSLHVNAWWRAFPLTRNVTGLRSSLM